MSTIMEDEVVESPTNTEQTPLSRTTSLEPTCLCKRVINNIRRPNVISISSCSDGQTTYEGPDGLSVTQTLIKILEKDPHPTYDHLMKEMSVSLFEQAQAMFKFYEKRKNCREGKEILQSGIDKDIEQSLKIKSEDETESYVINNHVKLVQDPQLGSENPLNPQDKFSP